ncbi:hypothetical protein SD71_08880 [Cohnella kolymensis]|uniref:HTH luxR-type domain-containing protein n=1 Tax=Cohnella kolymensis TaxID=1590652 RepID=A0ABR5A5T8_9BACL|nr:hypothetical protein [Cohnella kolymensis]KIL36098.1 hypothetical protein SD71_08880 [Cohnella kolymensis]
MNYKNPEGITLSDVYGFWKLIEDSYSIGQLYETYKNILVTLSDENRTCRFIYFKSMDGKGIRILKDDNTYFAVLWMKSNSMGGTAEGVDGKEAFYECLYLFRTSLQYGEVSLESERSPFAPSEHVPLTERERQFLEMREAGLSHEEIQLSLQLNHSQLSKIRRSLELKGRAQDDNYCIRFLL